MVLGKLEQCQAFPYDDVSVEMVESLEVRPFPSTQVKTTPGEKRPPTRISPGSAADWRNLLSPLRDAGRNDLAAAIDKKLLEFQAHQARLNGRDWRGRIKRLDRKATGGMLRKLKNFVQG